ncbi:MAG: hypothetical protein ACK5ES_03625, partial [Planctomyces sp.]
MRAADAERAGGESARVSAVVRRLGGGGMTENPFRQGDELYAVGSGLPGWRTVCRMIFRVLLNLLNGS